MFERVRHLALDFSMTGVRGEPLLKELLRLAVQLEILDGALEKAIFKGFATDNMVDIELAKEMFHARLRSLPKEKLKGWDPHRVFEDKATARPGRANQRKRSWTEL